jgi:hypothetical protein
MGRGYDSTSIRPHGIYIHGFAIYLRDVRRCKILGGKVMAVKVEGMNAWGGKQPKKQMNSSVVRVWEPGLKRSSFDVIPSFITRRRDRG